MNKGLLFLSILSLFIMSCGIIDPGAPDTDSADSEGNLVLINSSGSRLLVFDGEDRIKVVPNSSEDFLINVPNESGTTKDLKLYLYDDVDDYVQDNNNKNFSLFSLIIS